MSGGEKQKIAFASVYAMNPEIYLLDEPSSNLDMTSIQELSGTSAADKKRRAKPILIAEHRLYYLMDLADRIVYLEQGQNQKYLSRRRNFGKLPQKPMRERHGAAGGRFDRRYFHRHVSTCIWTAPMLEAIKM